MLRASRAVLVAALLSSGCGAPAPSHGGGCPGPSAGGAGLLANTVTVSSAGTVISPPPSPWYPLEAGDADLAVVPGTTIVVLAPAQSSNVAVLAPLSSPSGGSTSFRALSVGCAHIQIGQVDRSVRVRLPVS